MEININPSVVSGVLISMAAASLFTMLSLNQIGSIVHTDLYSFGLDFSYRWAMPYWVFSGIIIGLSWTNIVLSIIVTLYIFKKSRNPAPDSEIISPNENAEIALTEEENEQSRLSDYAKPQQKDTMILPKGDIQLTAEEVEATVQRSETIKTLELQETQSSQHTLQE
ncbi:MAG: hypothetical protein JSV05_05910 [Candidatus Bathyarchaeota archaeon]|nr:MAG: hypothetical protein JSV05_05910 [Candidatus Bathyarchaeota archaeon]